MRSFSRSAFSSSAISPVTRFHAENTSRTFARWSPVCANASSIASWAVASKRSLLIVLAVNVAEMRRELLQQRDRRRTIVDVNAALAVRLNLAVQQQFAVFAVETRLLQNLPAPRADFENARNARPLLARTNHVRGSAPAQQKAQRIHDNRFTAAGFAGEEIQARMESHAQPIHYGIIFNREFVQHSIRL